jgi:Thiol-activated cytolysin
MKLSLTLILSFCIFTNAAYSQTIKRTAGKNINKIFSANSCRFESENGNVRVSFAAYQPAKNDIKSISTPVNSAMCLTKEEVRGQKIENEQVIADGSKAVQILPGGVIDGETLLKSGQFLLMKMDKRKPISLSTSSNLAKVTNKTVTPVGNDNVEEQLRTAVHLLTRPTNLSGMPNIKSTSEANISTLEETMSLNIGASAFYMGISVEDNFSFSSEKYRYMYLYQFEQECLPVIANGVSSPADIFTDNTAMNSNWLYIREVKYGRRLYVLIESEYDLEKYSNELNGSLNWGVVAAAYSQKNSGSTLISKTNIRIITQGGQPVALTDISKLQQTLDKYFAAPFKDIDIVPLSYKLTFMDGKPVSMISQAFLNGDNCLVKSKVRIRVKQIECVVNDDGSDGEELYGSVPFYLYNAAKQQVAVDGKTVIPSAGNLQIPTSTIYYAKETAPIILTDIKGKNTKQFDINDQAKYSDITISNLDMIIELKPWMKEKDDFGDDVFATDNTMKKTIRQMLIEGSTTPVFEFRHDKSVAKIILEITPLY